jgi:hypothetical protein
VNFSFSQILLVITTMLLLGSCANTRAPVRQEVVSRGIGIPEPASILFVGNSYSFEVPKQLRKIAARNGRDLRIDQVTHGGWSLARHVQNEETLRKIREGGWDVVVIQEQSRIPSLPHKRERAMFPNVRKLAGEARAHGAAPVLYQTWGRRDGDEWLLVKDDFHAMTRRLREGYHEAARDAGGLAIVPVGDVWEREVNAGNGGSLFLADGSHPTARGDLLTAQTFFDALFPSL